MINITEDIHPLTTFKRSSADLMRRMKKTGRPLVLTINGKAEAVLLDPEVYQAVADQLDSVARIRHALGQIERGEARPAEEFLDELEREA